eukprot:685760_1
MSTPLCITPSIVLCIMVREKERRWKWRWKWFERRKDFLKSDIGIRSENNDKDDHHKHQTQNNHGHNIKLNELHSSRETVSIIHETEDNRNTQTKWRSQPGTKQIETIFPSLSMLFTSRPHHHAQTIMQHLCHLFTFFIFNCEKETKRGTPNSKGGNEPIIDLVLIVKNIKCKDANLDVCDL